MNDWLEDRLGDLGVLILAALTILAMCACLMGCDAKAEVKPGAVDVDAPVDVEAKGKVIGDDEQHATNQQSEQSAGDHSPQTNIGSVDGSAWAVVAVVLGLAVIASAAWLRDRGKLIRERAVGNSLRTAIEERAPKSFQHVVLDQAAKDGVLPDLHEDLYAQGYTTTRKPKPPRAD